MRSFAIAALMALSAPALAQPADPYAPAKPDGDAVLAEQVAQQLVERAQQLFDAKVFADAKQIAFEAIASSATGPAAAHARFIIKQVNQQLGLKDDTPPPPVEKPIAPPIVTPPSDTPSPMPKPTVTQPGDQTDATPIEDPTTAVPKPVLAPPIAQPHDEPAQPPTDLNRRIAATVHASLYGGLIGTMIGSLFSKSNEAAGAIPVGLVAAGAAGYFAPQLVDKLGWDEAQIRTTGAATVWGGVIGGFFTDAVTVGPTSGRQVLIGSVIGATVAGIGGAVLANNKSLTRGDVALVDTMAGAGLFGGLVIGMLMQPAKTEAISVNAVLGTVGGVIVGLYAAPRTNTTPRRMLRVAGLGALGGALPFLLYAAIHDKTTTSDERVTGLLSAGGIVGGLYLGFRLTDGMDEGLDTHEGDAGRDPKKPSEPPVAVISRSSDGTWDVGSLAIAPLDPRLSPQKGLAVSVLGAHF